MKRFLTFVLTAIILASVLASCASVEPESVYDANITLTSSDASGAAEWLSDRLGSISGKLVIGTDASAYGVDVSSLEADGYFIRDIGGGTAIFARTADGLDRAVRKYAKTVESGAAIGDVTYHEGCRIKRIEIAGRDISEYTIYSEDNKYMLSAARELASRIETACGARIGVSTDEPAAPYLLLIYVTDESLNTCGYRWTVDGGGVRFECSDLYKPTSAHYAVVRFLENELGWFGLTFGYESLASSELLSFPVGQSDGETNAFRYACPYGDQYSGMIGDACDHTYGDHYGGFTTTHLCGIPQCCHGMQTYKFGAHYSSHPDTPWVFDQPCYLDEDFLDATYDDVSAYIERQLAAGRVIGDDFCFVDIAAGDNGQWCRCKDCAKMFRDEGGAYSASLLTWANRLTEELNEQYPGLAYGVFAYAGTNKPPKTIVPNELIYVTYCYDRSCDMHAHDGRDCMTVQVPGLSTNHDNFTMSAQLERWTEITPNVYVWFYGMDQGLATLNYIYTVRDDLRYFHSLGVKGFFWEAEDYAFSAGKVAKWMSSALTWDIDMTDEEYDAYLDRVLAATYGDGASYVKDYIVETANIQRNGACAHCWLWATATRTVSSAAVEISFDTLFDLLETAILSADSAKQEHRLVKLASNCIYQGCLSSYFNAYEADDVERVAELERRWALIWDRLRPDELGFIYGGVGDAKGTIYSDMELTAWTTWKINADSFGLTVPTRPMPDRVASLIAELKDMD